MRYNGFFTFICFIISHLSLTQDSINIFLKHRSNEKIKTIDIGDYVEVKIVGIDGKIKGTLASAGLFKGHISSITNKGFELQLDTTSFSTKAIDSNQLFIELHSIEYLKASSKSRKTTKLLLIALPSTGVVTMLFIPYGLLPIISLAPVWVPTIVFGALLDKHKKYPIQNEKWDFIVE